MRGHEIGENCITRSFVTCTRCQNYQFMDNETGHLAQMQEKRNAYMILVTKPEGRDL
jgi:hypothetical protein